MKTIIFCMFVFGLVAAFVYFIASLMGYSKPTSTPVAKRNFKVRFDSIKEKYYITNELPNGKDQDVVGFFGFRKYYDDKFKIELIVEKLNEK